MKDICRYIRRDWMLELKGTDKRESLHKIVELIRKQNLVPDPDAFLQKILEREKQGSTGIGLGVAVPHARVETLENMFIIVARSLEGINFSTPDGCSIHLIFTIGVTGSQQDYLQLLSRISWLVRNESYRQKLFNGSSLDNVFKILITH